MPQRFDFGHVLAAQFGQRLLGEPGRYADAQGASGELQEGETARRIKPIKQVADKAAHLGTPQRIHAADDLAEPGLLASRADDVAFPIPDQRDGLGEIADIVVGIAEQHVVHALQNEFAQHRGLDIAHIERAGDGGKTITAIGVRRIAEIIGQQLQLAIAARRQHQAVEKIGKGFHQSPSSS